MTPQQLHKIIFDEVSHVLQHGAPGLSDLSRQSIATQAAVRLSHHLKETTFSCGARPWEKRDPPQECNWPCCSCDPYAGKVIAALQEHGMLS